MHLATAEGEKCGYGPTLEKNVLFYYKSIQGFIQDCRSYDLQNLGFKIKRSRTPEAALCWIVSTLMRYCAFFIQVSVSHCKDCPNIPWNLCKIIFMRFFLMNILQKMAPKHTSPSTPVSSTVSVESTAGSLTDRNTFGNPLILIL